MLKHNQIFPLPIHLRVKSYTHLQLSILVVSDGHHSPLHTHVDACTIEVTENNPITHSPVHTSTSGIDETCIVCIMPESMSPPETKWVACDDCDAWMHFDCIKDIYVEYEYIQYTRVLCNTCLQDI